jgi:hypothetical protein
VDVADLLLTHGASVDSLNLVREAAGVFISFSDFTDLVFVLALSPIEHRFTLQSRAMLAMWPCALLRQERAWMCVMRCEFRKPR